MLWFRGPATSTANEREEKAKEGGESGEGGEEEEAGGGGEISTRAGLTNDASLHMPRLTLQIRVQASWLRIREEEKEEEE